MSNFTTRSNAGLKLFYNQYLIMDLYVPITSQVHKNIQMNKIPYVWFNILFQHFHLLIFHLLLAMSDF